MRVEAIVPIRIVLSRRNLLALLSKLDQPKSKRTIAKADPMSFVVVVAEDDDEHYDSKTPGRMTPTTERFIRQHGGRAAKARRRKAPPDSPDTHAQARAQE